MTDLGDWWVTLRLDPGRSCDVRVRARSEWSAGWLARVLHPGVEVMGVRRVK